MAYVTPERGAEEDDTEVSVNAHGSPPVGGSNDLKQALLPASGEDEAEEPPPLRVVIVVTTTMFMGYAILVSFQHKLKDEYGIGDDSPRAHEWLVGVSMLYIFNLIFRIAHNFLFAPIKPRNRVYIAMGAMCCSMLTLVVFTFQLKRHDTLAPVYVAYALGGVGIGSFESNLLSAVTPLGHATKVWAVMGFPVGFGSVLIGGFLLHAVGVSTPVFYYAVLGAVLCGMAVYFFFVPSLVITGNAQTLTAFIANLREWREWFPKIHWYCTALLLDMYFVSVFSSVMFYIYDADEVPLFGPNSSTRIKKDWFFLIYNTFTMVGDAFSRRLIYHIKPQHPYVFLVLAFVGAALCLSKIAVLAPFGVMLVFACNGSVYASATRHIDTHVSKSFNLTSLSVWLFIGDMGSVTGSNTVAYIRGAACPSTERWMCQGK